MISPVTHATSGSVANDRRDPVDPTAVEDHVIVGEDDDVPAGRPQARVARAGEAAVGLLDAAHARVGAETLAKHRRHRRAVGPVLDDDDLQRRRIAREHRHDHGSGGFHLCAGRDDHAHRRHVPSPGRRSSRTGTFWPSKRALTASAASAPEAGRIVEDAPMGTPPRRPSRSALRYGAPVTNEREVGGVVQVDGSHGDGRDELVSADPAALSALPVPAGARSAPRADAAARAANAPTHLGSAALAAPRQRRGRPFEDVRDGAGRQHRW